MFGDFWNKFRGKNFSYLREKLSKTAKIQVKIFEFSLHPLLFQRIWNILGAFVCSIKKREKTKLI